MQAIMTKYIGPTNTKDSRVKAYTEAFPRGVTVSWAAQSDIEANHDRAAEAFIQKMGWHGCWVRGSTRDGYAYSCLSRDVEGRAICLLPKSEKKPRLKG